ncbi:MAG: hypothetical protein ACNI27_00470 [Desulfovibrio sp.]
MTEEKKTDRNFSQVVEKVKDKFSNTDQVKEEFDKAIEEMGVKDKFSGAMSQAKTELDELRVVELCEKAKTKATNGFSDLCDFLNVWVDEMKWLVFTLNKKYEIHRLEKELDREYSHLGRVVTSSSPKKVDKELAVKQIDFLTEEIDSILKEIEEGEAARAEKKQQRASEKED